MEKTTIAVLRVQGGWRLMRDRKALGHYDYRVDAEEAGVRLTQQLHRAGQDVELLVQEDASHDVVPMRGWATIH